MCGIAGILTRAPGGAGARGEARLGAAMDRLRHRGPDDAGRCAAGGVLLGHRRLSILDLSSAGHQPMASADGRLTITFNGEIYNYLELRVELAERGRRFHTGTDTEVLLAAYQEWGPACLHRLRGMFAFGLWDHAAGRLFLARDRLGEKPLYWWRDGARIAFASEIRALLELVPTRPALLPDAVDQFLHYQYVIEPGTLLEGVRKLPAGHVLDVGGERWDAEPEPWWEIERVPPLQGDPVALLKEAVERAVELTLRSDAPVGVALSGGLDSGVIAAIAARKRANLAAFTVGYPGSRDFDERAQARALAGLLGIPWHGAELSTGDFAAFFPTLVASQDEPVADVAAYGHYAVARLAAEHGVKVLLTGIGGDELFFGYGWVREALRLSRLKLAAGERGAFGRLAAAAMRGVVRGPLFHVVANRRLPAGWRSAVDHFLDPGKLDLAHPDEWVFYQLDYHWKPAERFSAQVYSDAFQRRRTPRGAYAFMRGLGAAAEPQVAITRLLFDSWLVSNCLALGDRVSMASSVEARIPLLDARLVETVVGLWRGGRTDDAAGHKLWLGAVARDWLPAEVLERPKRGFITPTAEWIAAVDARYRPQLLDGVLVQTGVLDGDRLRRWLSRAPAGLHRDFFQYKLTVLELWCRVVLHGDDPASL
ncbi:MAG TPA: asparagine synthase (glutamine-hydrolyzing) [Longimicrobium sp.]|nr:asparagine synthase (glutamine-hydrolyzing) [Longimicrobium sp.]